ncbi:MAG: PKD domain-containing protein [Phycisphaerae bacterium]|nr:PKD domain-containing protein [Phycisphaerae bacterium]
MVKVDFYVGETLIGVDGTYPYSVSWDSTTVADGTYIIKATATDTASQTASDSISVTVDNINDPPVADAGPDQTATVGQTVNFDGSGSSDPDGTIVSYDWDFGDDSTGTGKTIAHEYSIAGTYTVTLIVTDNGGETVQDTATVTVTEEPAEIEVFSDSFESSTDWTANWSQDSQNDWSRRTSRKKEGNYAAEVDGRATDAQLISIPIDLQGKKNATITFWWFIESGLDKGEYLAFDVSTDGGVNWTEMASLEGNVDPENTWHNVSIDVDVTAINNLRIRFRGTMSSSIEDAYVDVVKVVAW